MLTELSLFTGAGGGVLASILLGHRIVGYVENNEYCQKIIAQRIKDGICDEAPIFGDIRDFNSQGFASSYKGMVDVVSGGFPCQDISCAGKGAGITGERSGLWFDMETAIRIIRPRFVFIENSPMLFVRGFEHIICALSEMGYSARWGIVSAADIGAPHLRKRLWILANSMRYRLGPWGSECEGQKRSVTFDSSSESLADTKGESERSRLCQSESAGVGRRRSGNGCCEVSDNDNFNDDNCRYGASEICRKQRKSTELSSRKETIPNPCKPGLSSPKQETLCGPRRRQKGRTATKCSWWKSEPRLGRVAHGVANRVDRLRAIGNGQVPLVAATAWRILSGE